MSKPAALKPPHRAIRKYYDALATYSDQHVDHETAVRSAFQTLLADTAKTAAWTLIPELSAHVRDPNRARKDSSVRDFALRYARE